MSCEFLLKTGHLYLIMWSLEIRFSSFPGLTVLLTFVFIHLLVCFICFCSSVCIVVGWRKDAAPLSPLNMITSAGGLGTCKNGRGVRRMATISCHASLPLEGLISNQHTDPQYLEGVFCPTWFPQADCRLSLESMKSCLPRSWEIKLNILTTLYGPRLPLEVASLPQISEFQNSYIRKSLLRATII